ncbi:helix-turn-helix domain-containing protein [Pseudomonas fluorescens]|nr:helix-turn-helix domain-containing protein [Pseudomonas fluorescens]
MSIRTLQSSDVNQQMSSIAGWDQHYAQMSAGCFEGSLVHAQFNGVEAYEERMNTRVEQHFHAPQNVLVFSFDMTDGTLYLLGSDSENTWITPESYREVAVVVDAGLLQQLSYAHTLDGLLLTPLRSQQSQIFSSWLSHLLGVLSKRPNSVCAPEMSQQLVEDCLYVLECSSRALEPSPHKRLAKNRRVVATAFELACAHPDDSLNVLTLANAAGVSIRQLQQSFIQFTGIAPSSWLRLRRLNAARQDLLQASPSQTTVAEIAMRWSFWHLGRFSDSYCALFNEQPKYTLHRSR